MTSFFNDPSKETVSMEKGFYWSKENSLKFFLDV